MIPNRHLIEILTAVRMCFIEICRIAEDDQLKDRRNDQMTSSAYLKV
jgi:hypothetical protein